MEVPTPDTTVGAPGDFAYQTRLEFSRGLTGEREDKHFGPLRWRFPEFVGDPVDEETGLPASWSGNHQHVAFSGSPQWPAALH